MQHVVAALAALAALVEKVVSLYARVLHTNHNTSVPVLTSSFANMAVRIL